MNIQKYDQKLSKDFNGPNIRAFDKEILLKICVERSVTGTI